MAFSDAFLRGQAVARQDKEDKMAMVRAILARPRSGGGGRAVAPSPGYGATGGSKLTPEERSDKFFAEKEAEEDKKIKMAMVDQQMEAQDLENEMTRRALATMPTADEAIMDRREAKAMEAWDRAQQSAENLSWVNIQETARQDIFDAQMRNRARQGLADAFYRQDPKGMSEAFRRAFPGMEGGGGTYTLPDGTTKTIEGSPYPTFESDGQGNMYIRWPGSDRGVLFDQSDLRQFITASSPSLEVPMALAGGAGGGGTTRSSAKSARAAAGTYDPNMSAKEKADYAVNLAKANNDIMKTRIDMTNSMLGAGGDDLTTTSYTPEQWMEKFKETSKFFSSPEVAEKMGWPSAEKPARYKLSPKAQEKVIKGLADNLQQMVDNKIIEDTPEARQAEIRKIAPMIAEAYGPDAMNAWLDTMAPWLMPENVEAKIPKDRDYSKVDLGHGVGDLLVLESPAPQDPGEPEMPPLYDKRRKRLLYPNVASGTIKKMPPHMILALEDMYQTMVDKGDQSMLPMLEIVKEVRGKQTLQPSREKPLPGPSPSPWERPATGGKTETRFGA